MIIIKLRVKPKTDMTESFWKERARGITDEHGNPFRIIKLRWIWSRTNLCTNYQRTFGYDDAIIRKDKDSGGIKILYRKGALIWMRPPGGVGDFEAECPLTPHNIKMLISGYPNKKWYIVDDDIREIVKAGWEKKLSLMDEDTKQFNETWFKAMHTLKAEMGEKGVGAEAEVSMEKLELKEKQKDVAIREQEVSQREVRVKEQLAEVGETMSTLVEKGVEPVRYGEAYLKAKPMIDIRRMAKEAGVKAEITDKKGDLVEKILAKQSGVTCAIAPAPEHGELPTKGLDE